MIRSRGLTAFLTVQEGCDKFCSFCVVPYTRGAETSRPLEQVLTEARRLIEAGVRELTLLGQNVNAYHGLDAAGRSVGLGELCARLQGAPRDQVRATITQAWGQLQAAKAQMESAQAQVTASETALNGVREEARVGQRTTLDVLNAQQALVNARVTLVTAQHDRVVASYAVLSAIGRLAPQVLGLNVPVYDPSVHYHQVRDSWTGVRIPDGR